MIPNKKGTTLLGFWGGKSQEKFIMQRHIETIENSCVGEKCFHGCEVEKIHFRTGLILVVYLEGNLSDKILILT